MVNVTNTVSQDEQEIRTVESFTTAVTSYLREVGIEEDGKVDVTVARTILCLPHALKSFTSVGLDVVDFAKNLDHIVGGKIFTVKRFIAMLLDLRDVHQLTHKDIYGLKNYL